MAKPGLPKKYAKLGFKKGWIEYKKAKKARLSGSPAKPKKPAAKKPAAKKPAAKKVIIKKQTSNKAKTMGKSVKLLDKKTVDALISAGAVGVSAVGSTFLINKIPFIRDQKSWIKALTQAGIMIAGIPFAAHPVVKQFLSGFGTGAAISLIIPFLPEGFRFGGSTSGRRFNAQELAELQTIGKPIKISTIQKQKLGRAVKVGRPVKVLSMGHSRGKRGYADY